MKNSRFKIEDSRFKLRSLLASYIFQLVTITLLPIASFAADSKVVVAKDLIKRGQVIKVEDLGVEPRELHKVSGDVSLELDGVVDKVARIDIRPGMFIKVSMLDSKRLIKRGDNVTILAEAGSIKVTASGQAVEDGREGKFIRVLNLSSKKMVVGRVVGEETVAVNF